MTKISHCLNPITLVAAVTTGCATSLMLTANPAQAAVIFNGGSPNLLNGREMTQWVEADDFNLSQSKNLTSVDFWTVENGAWDGSLQYSLFTDAGSQPSSSAFASGSGINVVKTATGRSLGGVYTEYKYSFDLPTSVSLAANTTYWLGLHLNNTYSTRSDLYWETTSSGFGVNSQASVGGTFDNWSTNSDQLAFVLNSSPTAAVPEPFTVIGTLVGGTAALRMKKKLKSGAK